MNKEEVATQVLMEELNKGTHNQITRRHCENCGDTIIEKPKPQNWKHPFQINKEFSRRRADNPLPLFNSDNGPNSKLATCQELWEQKEVKKTYASVVKPIETGIFLLRDLPRLFNFFKVKYSSVSFDYCL